MYYYYFTKDNKILMLDFELDIHINPSYEPLTVEQTAFYEDYPDATVWEIRQCKKIKPYVPPVKTLKEVKDEALAELSQLSLDTLDKFIKVYQIANAQVSLYALGHGAKNGIYNEQEALKVLTDYNTIGFDLRAIYYEAETAIDDATDKDMVASLLNTYKQRYESYGLSDNE